MRGDPGACFARRRRLTVSSHEANRGRAHRGIPLALARASELLTVDVQATWIRTAAAPRRRW